jgi:hypothetical protein
MTLLEPFVFELADRFRLRKILSKYEPTARSKNRQGIVHTQAYIPYVVEDVDEDHCVEGVLDKRCLLDRARVNLDYAMAVGAA